MALSDDERREVWAELMRELGRKEVRWISRTKYELLDMISQADILLDEQKIEDVSSLTPKEAKQLLSGKVWARRVRQDKAADDKEAAADETLHRMMLAALVAKRAPAREVQDG